MKLFPFSGPDPKDSLSDSLLLKLIFLLISIMLCSLLGALLIQLLGYWQGRELAAILPNLNTESALAERNYVRLTHLLSQFFTFVLPSLLVAWFFYRQRMWRYLQLVPAPALLSLMFGVMIILFSFPLTQLAYWLNQQLPLPDWMSSLEGQAGEAIKALMVMDSPWVLLFNITVIALLPAIGEELLFRGILQQQLEKRFGRAELAVWITAFIFSAFHLQFAGFFPRLLLGALLGYLLVWTRSLWVPIAAHFVFNGIQILGQYLLGEELITSDTEQALGPNWLSAFFSLLVVMGGIYLYLNWLPREEKD